MEISFDIPGVFLLQIVVSTLLPLLVGLVTTYSTSPRRKSLLLLGLASVTGLLTELLQAVQDNTAYNLGTGVVLAIVSFIIGVGMHYGFYKPAGASASVQSIGSHSTE